MAEKTVYKVVPWTPEIDLTEFYKLATEKGYLNNSSQKTMIDCFKNEREKQTFVLLRDDRPIGSVASHTLDIMGPNAYRICARICVLTTLASDRKKFSLNDIKQHQNFSGQFLIPACIEWAGRDKDLYITTNNSPVASQRLVHRTYCPTLASEGLLTDCGEREYRGTIQTFWKMDVERFYESLNRYPKW